jgi:hypothetical protein
MQTSGLLEGSLYLLRKWSKEKDIVKLKPAD